MAEATQPPRDTLGRPLSSLRLSVTDRCNLRCAYCMPEEEYAWLPRHDLLTFEEIARLVDVFLSLGVDKLRLTGGEPLLRRDLDALVGLLSGRPGLRDLALTTNGVLLVEQAQRLRDAGLDRVTVSLDTLQPARFRKLTRRDDLERVLAGIEALNAAGFTGTKLDTVVMRGVNDDELVDLFELARGVGAELRYIEYMDVGGATDWRPNAVVPAGEILTTLEARYGPIESLPREDAAPADRFRCANGEVFGIIASTTRPFCASCDRSRLTADGTWYLCLYAPSGIDLRTPLRDGASTDELRSLLQGAWRRRRDRGAEERLAAEARGPLVPLEDLRSDPRLEMHTRGG
ncbi:MAG: GTP 3',8-cyclase MoaA [Planctomycetota bacterium]